jgi:5-methylcytosine-specific restriction protein B
MKMGAMSEMILDPQISDELKALLDSGIASGALMTVPQIDSQVELFRTRFGPEVLRDLDGEALLQLMHGRDEGGAKCLAYWLEFKNDDEFTGNRFGSIAGGSALKFGLYQRVSDSAWIAGSPNQQRILPIDEAIAIARRQRDELLAGEKVLAALDVCDPADEAYAHLQTAMSEAAPDLSGSAWAHKYWFLMHPNRLDDFHSPRYQRFHLLKLLQMPPDHVGILDWRAPRFLCAGRFVAAARHLQVAVTTLDTVLNQRDGFHRYWRIGTTAGESGESQWPLMRDGSFVSIGWSEQIPDLSHIIGQDKARDQIREWLLPAYPTSSGTASRKAGEILKFAQEIAENDLVLACQGQNVFGVGRVRGPYEYDGQLSFPHKRPVEWLHVQEWLLPHKEWLLTTVVELGRNAENLLELERRLYERSSSNVIVPQRQSTESRSAPLPPLDSFATRIESILRRKSQVVLYGPPGTGKTFHAIRVAKELAARVAFRKTLSSLTDQERGEIDHDNGLVRLCTFHPGYGYEDFVEGLRPRTVAGQMVFEPRDGIFKRLSADASRQQNRHYFLVIDEINRGDVPRVFGELITVIEQDKRGMSIVLPVTGSRFHVPRNVFLIGTMNTADRSISLLDAALRRRFGFVELMPDSSQLAGRKAGGLPLGAWLDALNARLRKHLKRDARNLQVGHAYFLPAQPITSVADFARVLRDDLVPLLEEYCYDDFQTLRDILGSALVDVEGGRIKEDLFAANREEELIQAVSFEQLEPLVLSEGPSDSPTEGAEAEDDDHDEDDGPGTRN